MTTVLRPPPEGQSTDPPAERLHHQALTVTQHRNLRALRHPRGTTTTSAKAPGGAS